MRPKVSLCMILRDSESGIRAALDSARGLYDELVVVMDSRSSDATERIVREEYGARVVVRDWLGFAEMRNESLREARNKWVMILDGDEVVADASDIVPALEVAEAHDTEAVFVTVESTNAAGDKLEIDRQIRFFRRDKCRYRFPIHNQLRGFREDRVGLSSLTIRATYTSDLTDRLARSEAPLRKLVKENAPGSEEWLHGTFFLSRCYGMVGRHEEAATEARALVTVEPKRVGFASAWTVLIRSTLATKGPDAALPIIVEALSHHPLGFADLGWQLIRLGLWHYVRGWQQPGPYLLVPQTSGRYFADSERAAELLGITFKVSEKRVGEAATRAA